MISKPRPEPRTLLISLMARMMGDVFWVADEIELRGAAPLQVSALRAASESVRSLLEAPDEAADGRVMAALARISYAAGPAADTLLSLLGADSPETYPEAPGDGRAGVKEAKHRVSSVRQAAATGSDSVAYYRDRPISAGRAG